jgi:uncharacterized protein (DUF885 family)
MSDRRTPSAAYQKFQEIYRTEWEWRLSELGDHAKSVDDPLDQLPDVSQQAQDRRTARWQQVLDQLSSADRDQLTPSEIADLDVYTSQLETLLGRQRFKMYQRPANADSAFWMELTGQSRRRLGTAEEAQAYIDWMRQIPAYVGQNIENMRAGVARGFGPARISMTGREATIRSVADAPTTDDVSLAKPLTTLPDAVAGHDQLIKDGRAVIETEVVPAYQRLLDFFTGEYYPALPTAIGAYSQPDGAAFYAAMLREFTTTELSAEEIHEIGLTEVASIREEMAATAAEAGFVDADAMMRHMRTDPSFAETTPQGLLRFGAWQAKKFDAIAHHYFGRLPRMRFGIVEPDPELAPYYTAGRGGPHTYVLNTYNLPARRLYSIPALTLHEAAPGHAFQIPFALEMDHPDFRRKTYISAYGEGWALYAERLGVEMGMYDTAFEIMGMLSYQMWRAVRLVIDPGMHALGWTRQQGLDYLRSNTALSDHEVTTEVDRYIAWPGQACAYYLGMLKIIELRKRAEDQLADAFSLPDFHDQVLSLGSVPLPVLEYAINDFIGRGGSSPFTD